MGRTTSRPSRGFSFIEIMLVVAIIAILASLVATNVVHKLAEAKRKATLAQISTLETALQQYALDADVYPTTSEGLQALVQRPASYPAEAKYPEFGYLGKRFVPSDAWGESFDYVAPSERGMPFEISSAGGDRQRGTADDLGNWQETKR